NLEDFELKPLTILIGGNGAGKSNFVEIFMMLWSMARGSFSRFIEMRGGADDFLHNGPKETGELFAEFRFKSRSASAKGANSYRVTMTPTVDETFILDEERKYSTTSWRSYGPSSQESRLQDEKNEKSSDGRWNGVGHFVYDAIAKWQVYHFHDTGRNAPMRRSEIVEDRDVLRADAANIAPFLRGLRVRPEYERYYRDIVNAVRLVIPFFEDFRLDVVPRGEKEKVKLTWQQKGSDYPMQPYHLSDGSIRFICLATALLQPNPPSIIIIDEPELGLHPSAIVVLAELIEAAAERTQVIAATQSPALIDQFTINDIVVVSREKGASTFKRLKEEAFSEWLEDFSVGELWKKDVIAGGPVYE
ncbi:MAG: AAA family ATPase, partial [Fibrobacterota bacterium]